MPLTMTLLGPLSVLSLSNRARYLVKMLQNRNVEYWSKQCFFMCLQIESDHNS